MVFMLICFMALCRETRRDKDRRIAREEVQMERLAASVASDLDRQPALDHGGDARMSA